MLHANSVPVMWEDNLLLFIVWRKIVTEIVKGAVMRTKRDKKKKKKVRKNYGENKDNRKSKDHKSQRVRKKKRYQLSLSADCICWCFGDFMLLFPSQTCPGQEVALHILHPVLRFVLPLAADVSYPLLSFGDQASVSRDRR